MGVGHVGPRPLTRIDPSVDEQERKPARSARRPT